MEPALQWPINVFLNPNSHDIANVIHLNGSPVQQFYGSTTQQFHSPPIPITYIEFLRELRVKPKPQTGSSQRCFHANCGKKKQTRSECLEMITTACLDQSNNLNGHWYQTGASGQQYL